MRMKVGDVVTQFDLPTIEGKFWSSDRLQGKPYMLSFYRFAGCPFCNLRLHRVINMRVQLSDDFHLVAVFESSLENLQRYAGWHQADFPILADEGGMIHAQYGIEHSWLGVMKGMLLRIPDMLIAVFRRGYLPRTFGGKMNTMPADFLVDKHGIIQVAYYGSDEGDHLPLDQLKNFALQQGPEINESKSTK